MIGLNLDALPEYLFSSMRNFEKNECHVRRICSDDVLLLVFKGVLRFSEDGKADFTFKGIVPGCVHSDLKGIKIPNELFYRDNAENA